MKKILSIVMCMAIVFSAFAIAPSSISAANLSTAYSLTGNGANDIVAVAQAQLEKSQSQLGYSGNWCAAFVSDCANLAGQSQAIPYHAAVSSLYNNVINAGGTVVTSPQKGDIAFYKSGSSFCHVSIVTSSDGTTIHGNVSWCTSTGKDNGVWHVCTRKPNVYENAMNQYHVYVRPNYKTTTHTHSYDTYVYYLLAHPHYSCYKCSCGDIKHKVENTNYRSTCVTCNPPVYDNVSNDNYFIRNASNDMYLNVTYSEDVEGATIHTFEYGDYDARIFNITKASNGYEMRPLSSTARVVKPNTSSVNSGTAVKLYQKSNNNSDQWNFQPWEDGYIIRNMQSPNLCLTVVDGGLTVTEYSGTHQLWYLEKACTINYDANGGTNAPNSHRIRAGYDATISDQIPTKDNGTFLGWSTEKNAKTPTIKSGETMIINDDTTLYAVWENNSGQYGDVDGNGEIDATDALLVLQYTVGKMEKFPVEE